MGILKKLIAVLVILILVNIGFVLYGQASFEATIKTLGKAFAENNATEPVAKRLPENIRSYIQKSGLEKNPYKILALQLEGQYRNKPSSKWMKMHALALLRPSADMLWGIRLESNPIVTFNALETYHAGKASMQMLLFGIIPTGEIENSAFARSELARVLAYGAYNPALLKLAAIEYRAIDDRRVEATIRDANISATVTFFITPAGDIAEVTSQDRIRPLKQGGMQRAGWRMRILSYGEFDGLRLPREVEEAWIIDGNALPYSKTLLDSAKRL